MAAMLSGTMDRVSTRTSDTVNRRIREEIEKSVIHHAYYPAEINARLEALDREWDIERTLEANAATLALTGVLLGAFVDRRFLALPVAVTAFLLQHTLQGWCPPLPFLRRWGVRTMQEINEERFALKALRGDFDGVTRGRTPRRKAGHDALAAVRA